MNELASKIDATIYAPHAMPAAVHKIAADAMRLGVAGVFAPPVWTSRLATMLRGSGVRVGSLVAFPFGTNKPTLKAIEATSTIKDGADEIEVVGHLPHILSLDLDGARAELIEIVRASRSARRDIVIRIIVEMALLLRAGPDRAERMVEIGCRAARESGCDGIVTGTGLDHQENAATVDAVALVKKYGEALSIKAAVVNDAATARSALAAGADRVAVGDIAAILES